MANTMRWRYGDTNPVRMPVAADTVIEIGDAIYQEASLAKPAAAMDDQGSELLNQQFFQDDFVGIAMQSSAAGDTADIRIATTGVFEFDCNPATFDIGDLVSLAANGNEDGLENQKAVQVASVSSSLGRCAKQANPAQSRVLVDIVSTVMRGGPQAAA